MNCKLFFLIITNIALVLSSYAQDKGNPVELKEVLNRIAVTNSVTFNYLEDEIALFKIIPPTASVPLQEKLDYITDKTQLTFVFITANSISVTNKKKVKKICGYLIDNETKQKINKASIHYIGTNNFSISNNEGYFELLYIENSKIEINYLGFEKLTLQSNDLLSSSTCNSFFLKPIQNELNEVVTTVFLTKGISKKIDGSFELQPKNIEILPGLTEPDVFQSIQQLPGISSTDETISNINIRGGSHDQNLFLWNDIKLYQTGHFYGLISVLNPNTASKVAVIKNGSSAFYSESVSSTVSISTATESDENSSSIGLNMLNLDFNTKQKTSEKSSIEISGRRSYTDFVDSPTYTNYKKRIFQNTAVTNLSDNQNINFNSSEKFYFYDASVQFKQEIKENTTLFANFITISNQLDLNQSKEENNTIIERNSFLEQQSLGGSLVLTTDLDSKNSSKITLYGLFYKINAKNESIEGNQVFIQENNVLDTGIKIENSHILNTLFTFKNGYQFNEIGIRNSDEVNSPQISRSIKEVIRNHALITEIHYLSKDSKLNSTFGIRQNYISQFKKYIFEPRVQLNYELSTYLSTQFLGEFKHQTTSQIIDLQQDFLGIEKRRWILVNNENIPVLQSKQFSIGFTYKKRNWLLSVDNFYKNVAGITSKSQGFQNQLEFENLIGAYNTFGTELLVQKQILNFTSWVSYSATKNNYTFDTYIPEKFPNNFEIQHYVATGISYKYQNLSLSLGSKWFTGRPTTLPLNETIENNTIAYKEPNSDRLKDYFQTNISAGYKHHFKEKYHLKIGASVQNIFNTENIINQFFRVNQNTESIEKVNTFSLERTPNAFVRVSF